MTVPDLRIGIVGCGQMGRKHATNCCRIPGVSVVAVADKDRQRSTALAGEIHSPAFDDAASMISSVLPDAVVIATPPGERLLSIEEATSAAIPVLVEKPLALDMDSAEAYCEMVKRTSVLNAVGFHLRYSPLTQRARALIAGRKVTHVRTVTTTSYYLNMDMPHWFLQRKHSGGPLLEQTLHVIDTVRFLVGDISQVVASGGRLVRPELADFDSEDSIVLAYRLSNGVLGTHTDSCAMLEFNWEVELMGPDWRLKLDFARSLLEGNIEGERTLYDATGVDLHMIEIQAFLEAVRSRSQGGILSDFADAARTMATVLAADRSLTTGNWEEVRADR